MLEEGRIHREARFHDQRFATRSRRDLAKYYAITRHSRNAYRVALLRECAGKRVLEYGCGAGSSAFPLAAAGARVTGIDISSTAIDKARGKAERRGLPVRFEVANAEATDFADASFDLVCGTGILHHLDVDAAYAEIRRVLTPQGKAIFTEPMGHNPIINAFRRKTPKLRTADEHPLLMADLERAAHYFGNVEARFFHLTTLAAVPLKRVPRFDRIVDSLHALDGLLFQVCPYLKRHAWMTVLTLSAPPSGGDPYLR